MHAREPLHGVEGAAYATIEGSRYLLFQLKNFEGNWEKGKNEIPRLGTRKKVTGQILYRVNGLLIYITILMFLENL